MSGAPAAMNLLEAKVALRERTFLDVLDLAVRFVFARKRAYAKTALVVLLPSFLVTWAFGEWSGWAWGWAFAVGLGLFAQAPFTSLVSRLVFADTIRVRDAISGAAAALGRLLGARIIQGISVGGGLLFLVMPGMLLAGVFLFVLEVCVLERASVGATITRAQRLSAASYGETVLAAIVLGLAPFLSVVLADFAGRIVVESLFEARPPESLWHEGGGWLPLLGFWLVLPIVATARFFLYLNVRTRTEGWDIQTRFAAIASRAAAEAAEEGRA